jgi:hypothetical protein
LNYGGQAADCNGPRYLWMAGWPGVRDLPAAANDQPP